MGTFSNLYEDRDPGDLKDQSFSEFLKYYFLIALLYAEYLNFLAILVISIFKTPAKCLQIIIPLCLSSSHIILILQEKTKETDI